MSERDEPRTDLHLIIKDIPSAHDPMLNVTTPVNRAQIVDAILEAGYRKPRTITTAEELDALPFETVIKSSEGNVWESLIGGWFETASRASHATSDIALPATVLWEPLP